VTASVGVLAASALPVTLLLTLCVAYQLRVQQREIEDGHRKQVGRWLRQNASSTTDSVMLEPLGYIGFFSQLKMLDSPGLCAPEVVAAEKKLKSISWAVLIPELQPGWLVLRSSEANLLQSIAPDLLTNRYSAAKVFDASERLASYRWLPGRGYLEYDKTFIVFRRKRVNDTIQRPSAVPGASPALSWNRSIQPQINRWHRHRTSSVKSVSSVAKEFAALPAGVFQVPESPTARPRPARRSNTPGQ
jgi:hypothetical protein